MREGNMVMLVRGCARFCWKFNSAALVTFYVDGSECLRRLGNSCGGFRSVFRVDQCDKVWLS